MNIFRTAILGFFALFIVLSVLIFSGVITIGGGAGEGIGGNVVMWGTVPKEDLGAALETFRLEHNDEFSLAYIEKSAASFDRELVEALASNVGPDLILLPQNLIIRHDDKALRIPYESLPLRQFKDTFIEEGELYVREDGIIALPFLVDPMVLYWNRDILNSEGIVKPPSYWDEFYSLAPELTVAQPNLTITRSAIGLGEYQNITHAKDILTLLMLQAGEPIVAMTREGPESVLGQKHGFVDAPAVSALRFYTEFSNVSKPYYSWNRALPNDKEYFARGDLALYLGYASEYKGISARNPNLNFDVARVPQARDTTRATTHGTMTGIAILKNSKNPRTALYAASLLTGGEFVSAVLEESTLSPARRDLLKGSSAEDAVGEVVNSSALIARSWLDPQPQETERIFQEMIENTVSGRSRLTEAISRASERINILLQ